MDDCNEILTQNFVSGLNSRDQRFLKDSVIKSLKKHRQIENKYHERALKMYEFLKNTIVTEDPCSFHGLKWEDDSCYMDSVLMCLVAVPDSFIDNFLNSNKVQKSSFCKKSKEDNMEIITKIKKEILSIQKFIRDGKGDREKCTILRKIFSKCDSLQEFKNGYQDAGEFLTMLFGVFDELDVCVRKDEKYHTDKLDIPIEQLSSENASFESKTRHNTTINQYVENYIITHEESAPFFHISDFLTKTDVRIGTIYGDSFRSVLIEKIVSAPYLVFNIQRRGEKGVSNKTIIPDEIIYTDDGTMLEFTGVVVYNSRHYTCFFSCRKIWYKFNDIKKDLIVPIGTYEKLMIHHGAEVVRGGTIYFYSEMFENMA
jgi:hypothetical protein